MVDCARFELVAVVRIGGADDGNDAASVAHQRCVHTPETVAGGLLPLDVIAACEEHYVTVCFRLDAAVDHAAFKHRRRRAHEHHAARVIERDIRVGAVPHVFDEGEHLLVAKVISRPRSADAGGDAGSDGAYLLRHERTAVLVVAVVNEEDAHKRHAHESQGERGHYDHVQTSAEIAALEGASLAAFPLGRKAQAKEEQQGDEDACHPVEEGVDGAARNDHRFRVGHHIDEMGEAAAADEFVALCIHGFGEHSVHLHRIGEITPEAEKRQPLIAGVGVTGRDEHFARRRFSENAGISAVAPVAFLFHPQEDGCAAVVLQVVSEHCGVRCQSVGRFLIGEAGVRGDDFRPAQGSQVDVAADAHGEVVLLGHAGKVAVGYAVAYGLAGVVQNGKRRQHGVAGNLILNAAELHLQGDVSCYRQTVGPHFEACTLFTEAEPCGGAHQEHGRRKRERGTGMDVPRAVAKGGAHEHGDAEEQGHEHHVHQKAGPGEFLNLVYFQIYVRVERYAPYDKPAEEQQAGGVD